MGNLKVILNNRNVRDLNQCSNENSDSQGIRPVEYELGASTKAYPKQVAKMVVGIGIWVPRIPLLGIG
ncbi:hypothetical protein HanHA300_Chr02g0044511 [Helianthus annuus]|nr:hypothetical protein HanHA300_Chr02g0044511 [Helianthus annuus]KAJ0617997.1 hypothetical protein HanHA89_Chr02g0048131 [Helianthus annuus]